MWSVIVMDVYCNSCQIYEISLKFFGDFDRILINYSNVWLFLLQDIRLDQFFSYFEKPVNDVEPYEISSIQKIDKMMPNS